MMSLALSIEYETVVRGLNASDITVYETSNGFYVESPRKAYGEWFIKFNTEKQGDIFDVLFTYNIDSQVIYLPRIDLYFYQNDVNLNSTSFLDSGYADDACYSYTARNGNELIERQGWFKMWGEQNCYSFKNSEKGYNGTCTFFDDNYAPETPTIVINKTYIENIRANCRKTNDFTIVIHSKLISPTKKNNTWEIYNFVIGEESIIIKDNASKKPNTPSFPKKSELIHDNRTPVDEFFIFMATNEGRLVGFGVTAVIIVLFGLIAVMRIKKAGAENNMSLPPKGEGVKTADEKMGGTILLNSSDDDERMTIGEDQQIVTEKKNFDRGIIIAKDAISKNEAADQIEKKLMDAGYNSEEIGEIINKANQLK